MPRRDAPRALSVPQDFYSALPGRGVLAEHSRVSDICYIKTSRDAPKAMRVNLTATAEILRISFEQEGGGPMYSFELCKLSLTSLVVGWIWGDQTLFAIAVEHNGQLCHPIFVYPRTTHRILLL